MDKKYRLLSVILLSLIFAVLASADQIAAQIPPQYVIIFSILVLALREVVKEYGQLNDETA